MALPYLTLAPAAGGAVIRVRSANARTRAEQVVGAVVPSASGSPRSQVRVTGAVYECATERYRPADLSALRAQFPSGSRVLCNGRMFSADRAGLAPQDVPAVIVWGPVTDTREGYALFCRATFTLTTATPPV